MATSRGQGKRVAEKKPAQPGRRGPYRKGEATRAHVVNVARDCIVEMGFRRTSSRIIARRSGVTWGVIQHHFGTYEAVLLAVVEQAVEELGTRIEASDLETGMPAERLDAISGLVWSYYEQPEYLTYLEVYMNLVRDPETSDQARESLRAVDRKIERLWLDLFERAFGDLAKDTRNAMRQLIFATMRGLAISRWLREGARDFAKERAAFVDAMAAHFLTPEG